MTGAGTIKPCKVVIMGAGVAGLQAIATAKRLGAIVEVSDIRPETKEQVESFGGKFIEVVLSLGIPVLIPLTAAVMAVSVFVLLRAVSQAAMPSRTTTPRRRFPGVAPRVTRRAPTSSVRRGMDRRRSPRAGGIRAPSPSAP